MNIDCQPLSLYQTTSVSFNYFQDHIKSQMPAEIILIIKKYYIDIAQSSIYDQCKTKINNDLFQHEFIAS